LDLSCRLGDLALRSPLVAASGTVGSVVDFAGVGSLEHYGAAVAKSVSGEPWPGKPSPRLTPAGAGLLNGIGIQNPGIEAWAVEIGSQLRELDVPVWGSAVGRTPEEFATVATGLVDAGVAAVEVNLSCPNLDDGKMFALDPVASTEVVSAVREAVGAPIGAKLSPNTEDIVAIAEATVDAGADFLVLTNTVWGASIDPETRRPGLSGLIGGLSGPPLKPIALRCVLEVHRSMPEIPIVGCGGVRTGGDVIEYLLAGAAAVAVGTAHFATPRIGRRITKELHRFGRRHGVAGVTELVGAMEPW
jgi:dihydroorotate dehydrogenase (NAD+) catalytic subunit